MTDRELLERAAKAAGIDGAYFHSDNPLHQGIYQARGEYYWNPLFSDSEALRLAVRLGIAVLYADFSGEAEAKWNRGTHRLTEYGPDDPMAATRRAIVRAAAAISEGEQR